jgi:hypothetical protein
MGKLAIVTISDVQTFDMMCLNRLVAWLLSFAVDAEMVIICCMFTLYIIDAQIELSPGSRSKLTSRRLRGHSQQQRRSIAD